MLSTHPGRRDRRRAPARLFDDRLTAILDPGLVVRSTVVQIYAVLGDR
jgi:hypothetical protein